MRQRRVDLDQCPDIAHTICHLLLEFAVRRRADMICLIPPSAEQGEGFRLAVLGTFSEAMESIMLRA
jgi:hypothetical protein